VFALILAIGTLQFFCVPHIRDFLGDDVFWADSARSLVDHGYYGINGYTETNMPPGLPVLLAMFHLVGGLGYTGCQRLMVVFATLGFCASFEVLRRQVPRGVAASICLLLISSRIHFTLATRQVGACCPYFFTSMTALWAAAKLETAKNRISRLLLGGLFAGLVVASLALQSVGTAFLAAIVAGIFVAALKDRRVAFERLRTYLPALLLGLAAQGIWTHSRTPEAASAGIASQEWSLPGFPQSYWAQLKLKSGHDPEQGLVASSDIANRIFNNACDYANLLSRMIFQRMPNLASMSVFIIAPVFLIVLGWLASIQRSSGGLQDWYFAVFGCVYFLWPWNAELRFLLPVAPLACLYMWRGAKTLGRLAQEQPRRLGFVWCLTTAGLGFATWFWMSRSEIDPHLSHPGIGDDVSFATWVCSVILALWMIWAGTEWSKGAIGVLRRHLKPPVGVWTNLSRLLHLSALIIVPCFVFLGLMNQLAEARDNLDSNSEFNRAGPDVQAATWICSHTSTNAVVMARQVPTVCHYSERKVIWFPPSSEPQMLLAGILRHKVDYVLVVNREFSYYLPPDAVSFNRLQKSAPEMFRLVHQGQGWRVFQVVGNRRFQD
jgi:hypothetical protein